MTPAQRIITVLLIASVPITIAFFLIDLYRILPYSLGIFGGAYVIIVLALSVKYKVTLRKSRSTKKQV